MKRFLSLLLFVFIFISAARAEYDLPPSYPFSAQGEATVNDVVFYGDGQSRGNNRVFYEIFVGSFSDSNGDGIGDLRGIINRLDYLNDGDPASGLSLGVEGLWLTPIFQSPSYHKYDVTDYYTVDPSFGTLEDLQELIALCHQRGMLLILDLPINHTSKDCRWFKNFSNAHLMRNPGNTYYDFYAWWSSADAVPAGRTYSKLYGQDVYYEANFSQDMPELNFENDLVRQTLLDVALYYLRLGVDGFRFDAAKYIDYGNNARCAAFWDWYIGCLRAEKSDVYTVAEVWDGDGITALYTPITSCFQFTLSQSSGLIAETAKAGDANRLTAYMAQYLATLAPQSPCCLFIANHDTDRAAGYLTAASGQAQMAANLYLLSPGSPFIYYGEEIALRGSRGGASTDANRRLAMLWGDGDTVQDPEGATYDPARQTPYSVKDLLPMSTGLYNYYKRLLMIRRANPEIADGTYTALRLEGTKAGGFVCTAPSGTVAVFHNPGKSTQTIDLRAATDLPFTVLAASIGMGGAALEDGVLTLEGQTSAVLRTEVSSPAAQ